MSVYEIENGNKYWYLNGKLHRLDGPAIEYANGTKEWWINGKLHRTDGPAVECTNGYKVWYVNDELLTETEFNEKVKIIKTEIHKTKLENSGNTEHHRIDESTIEDFIRRSIRTTIQ